MPKKTKISQDELDTFHEAMKGTKPLVQKKPKIIRSPKTTVKTIHRPAPIENDEFNFSDDLEVGSVAGEEFISYKHHSVSNKILRKLRKGQYNVDAKLDLHGMSIEEAKNAVDGFLHQCLHAGMRVVLIIHGKGHHSPKPILKNKLNSWLRSLNVVLAFCSAAPSHGSRGAMYILLKRTEEDSSFR